MKGKIKKLVEDACPLHLVINGQLLIATDYVHSLLSAIRESDLPVSVSLRYSNSWFSCFGMDSQICYVNFEYDKE